MAICSADGCSRTEPCGPFCRDRGNLDPKPVKIKAVKRRGLVTASELIEMLGTVKPDTPVWMQQNNHDDPFTGVRVENRQISATENIPVVVLSA